MTSPTPERKLRKSRAIGEPIRASALRTLIPFVISGYNHYFVWVEIPGREDRRRLCYFTGLRQNGTTALVVRKATKEAAGKLAKENAIRIPEWPSLFGEGLKVFLARDRQVPVTGLGTDHSPQMEYCGKLVNES